MIQSRDHFPQWLTEHGLTGMGVEIGTYYGQFAEHILKNWPGVLFCFDPYVNYPKDEYLDGCNLVNLEEVMYEMLNRLKLFGERFHWYRQTSLQGSIGIENDSLDFCYIDGNHDFKHVSEDIKAWWPKVRSEGVLGGHDYLYRNDESQRCDVKRAVDEFSSENPALRIAITPCTSWFFHKP